MKVALILLALCACERADSTAQKHPPPPPPTPTKPDPVKQAHDEFELIASDYAVGTHKLYSRGDFMADSMSEEAFDQGDFIGRLRTLFGAREGGEYVFRHKQTGYVITAYFGDSGPAYGGGPRYQGALPAADPKALMQASFEHHDDPAAEARRKADPLLAKGSPMDHLTAEHPLDPHELATYMKHMEDAEAGPELAGVVARLDALISSVQPADWETTYFYDEGPAVIHVGARGGSSFDDELPPAQAFEFLAHEAAARDPKDRDELGRIPFDADTNLIQYFLDHADELAEHRPEVVAAYQRFLTEAKSYDGDLRTTLLDQAREWRTKLHVR